MNEFTSDEIVPLISKGHSHNSSSSEHKGALAHSHHDEHSHSHNHHDDHSHSHHAHDSHGHAHSEEEEEHEDAHSAISKLTWSTVFSIIFMIIEIVGGYMAGSLAIMSDAAHLLTDVASNLVSIAALYIGALPADYEKSYGYSRAEVIGAIISVLMIWALTGILLYEAILRTITLVGSGSHEVRLTDGRLMTAVAGLGLVFNLVNLFILGGHSHGHGGHGHSHGHHGHNHQNSEGSENEHGHEQTTAGWMEVFIPSSSSSNVNVRSAAIHALGDLMQVNTI